MDVQTRPRFFDRKLFERWALSAIQRSVDCTRLSSPHNGTLLLGVEDIDTLSVRLGRQCYIHMLTVRTGNYLGLNRFNYLFTLFLIE
jgi:hypothetical protein